MDPKGKNAETASKLVNAAPQAQTLKFPYPVLNDKRDITEILTILEAKEVELNKKIQQTKLHYKEKTSKTDKDMRDKLKTLYKNFKSQLSKIETQIDYIKTDLRLKKLLRLRIKKKDDVYKESQRVSLSEKHEKLVSFMKAENRKFLVKNSRQKDGKTGETEAKEKTPPPVALIGPAMAPPDYYQNVPPPTLTTQWNMQQTQINSAYMPTIHAQHYSQSQQQIGGVSQYPPLTSFHSTFNTVQPVSQPLSMTSQAETKAKSQANITNYLIYLIAQTSAAAHAAASITAAAYNPPPPPPSAPSKVGHRKHTQQLEVTNRSELAAKATSSFAKYKDRIQSFLNTDKIKLDLTNPLRKINVEYNDAEDDDDNESDKSNKDDSFGDDIDNVSVYSEDVSDTELEIVLKSSSGSLNYILPSAKLCGLHVTWEQRQNNPHFQIDQPSLDKKKNAQLFAAQRSAFSLTFMGTPFVSNRNPSLSTILYKCKE
jgi:hypothetical protein